MKPLVKAAGWQVLPLRASLPRQSRRTWRARWPVMVGATYAGPPRRINGLYVRVGRRLRGICIMPWHPQPGRWSA